MPLAKVQSRHTLSQQVTTVSHGVDAPRDGRVFVVTPPSGLTIQQLRDQGEITINTLVPGSAIIYWGGFRAGQTCTIILEIDIDQSASSDDGLNVKDFGAVGDAVADDSASIRAAVAAANVTGGAKCIYFPPAVGYKVTYTNSESGGDFRSTVNIPSEFTVIGSGRAGPILMTGTSATPETNNYRVFRLAANAHHVTFENLCVIGENDSGSFVNVDNSTTGVLVADDGANIDDITIRNCDFQEHHGFAVHAPALSVRWRVENCRLQWCANGVNINGSNHVFIGNSFYKSEGYEIAGGANVVMGNSFKDCFDGAIAVGGFASSLADFESTIVANNVIDGITVNNGGGASGIVVVDQMNEVVISGNNVTNCAGFGLDLETFLGPAFVTKNHTITGNIFTACANGGKVAVAGAGGYALISNNIFNGSTSGLTLGVETARMSHNTIISATNALTIRDGGTIYWDDNNTVSGAWVFDGTCTWIGPRFNSKVGTDVAEASYVQAEANPMFKRTTAGKMSFGAGGASATDLHVERSAAAILKVTGKVVATAGLGVGNSAAATVLGSVVGKIEVFDTSGNSLGYWPVYDNIT